LNPTKLAAWCATVALIAPLGIDANVPASPAAPHALSTRESAMIAALRKRVKYVFVIYQENRSFDSYFGTFPGADGIYSQPASATLGYSQPLIDTTGNTISVSPFRIGPARYAADTDDVDHSHPRLISKIDVTGAGPQMDRYALTEEEKYIPPGTTLPTLQAKQYGELTMAHEDCDTVPLLWNYANRFVLFDHIFQSLVGPSTPGNIAIVSGQAGETQYGLHPTEGYPDNGSEDAGVPVLNDRDPAWGPYNPGDGATQATEQLNLTFASLPLTLAGSSAPALAQSDPKAATDFADLGADVSYLAKSNVAPQGFGWYQEGYDREPGKSSAADSLVDYVTHHNGPQYFGYVANSSARAELHGLGDFYHNVAAGLLPQTGGVFYVKGGYQNILKLKPADPDPTVQTNFVGDDDHPGYSDAQISEANVAEAVNTIAKSSYWPQSAIVIAWDDSEGDYDHVAPPLLQIGPGVGNLPQDFISQGPRVPLIVISPFAKTHYVGHSYGDQGSVVKLIDEVFALPRLGSLPDEKAGEAGAAAAGHPNFLPEDAATNGVSNLLEAFDVGRLEGTVRPIPAGYVEVPEGYVRVLPQETGLGCAQIGIIPVDEARGIANVIPADFNPRPGTDPTPPGPRINARREVMRAADPED
jgi:phospholipase C